MADATYQTKIRMESGGDKIGVASGGEIDIESGGALKIAGTDRTAALATAPAGVAAGYKIARGETALDGSNPTSVAHGLTTCIAFVAMLKGTAAPGVGTSVLTANINGANVDVYAWKVTAAGDATLIASTGTESFYWIAIGT
ncbi:MAG: hypothetical protein C4583_03020 [Anaerolineaceae bacterium]|nr:MAG: hypothetical protein C4583_03020 [Anaerolineaceae bacterium]